MNHVSTLRLHQLRLGEIDGEEAGRIRAHLADCDTCARRFDVHAETRAAFQKMPVPAWVEPAPSFGERLRALWKWPVLLVPAIAALLFVVRPAPIDEGVREKGAAPVLEAWVEAGESARPLYTGERVGAGTRVQLKFDPGRRRFVTLAGRDGTGTVEVYATVPGDGPGLKTAPFALTLDESPGDQEFFAVLTDSKPDPDAVIEALASDPVRMERGEIASVVLQKE
ncbi:MAG: anti-sigma factor family protein [Myxococcota bacterium]